MWTGDDALKVQQAVRRVQESGRELEHARARLVLDADLAIAAGAEPDAVAKAAGVQPATLRMWLTSTARPDRGSSRQTDDSTAPAATT